MSSHHFKLLNLQNYSQIKQFDSSYRVTVFMAKIYMKEFFSRFLFPPSCISLYFPLKNMYLMKSKYKYLHLSLSAFLVIQ